MAQTGAPTQAAAPPAPTPDATAPSGQGIAEVIVTAQKRAENVNTVPMSISTETGDQLAKQGINSPNDLTKIVPGFQYTQSLFGEPVFTLRGVGFYDTSVGARPAVTVYVDEVPLPFGVMTDFASLDVQRVEVLKGPQGTVFGQNSTGGAINYIANKPTKTPEAGVNLSYGRFGQLDASGYISGPITDTLSGRLAVETDQGGDWQKNYVNGASLGQQNRSAARLLLDWKPTDRLKFELNANVWFDRSDVPAGQLIGFAPNLGVPLPDVLGAPLSPQNDRAAAWTPGINYTHHGQFLQGSLRTEYDITNHMTLTSITSAERWIDHYNDDPDGEVQDNVRVNIRGDVDTFYQELRLSGDVQRLKWLGGVTYENDTTHEHDIEYNPDSSVTPTFEPINGLPFLQNPYFTDARYKTYAVFANADYSILDNLVAHAGVRYTDVNSDAYSASLDSPNGAVGSGFSFIFNSVRAALGLPPIPYVPGGPDTVDAEFAPEIAHHIEDESNTSWRVGMDWTPVHNTLLYFNVSKGFKGGGFPVLEATEAFQVAPVKQESVLAYEVGFKSTLFDHRVQANGAIFYYDYTDKQFIGRINLPPLGTQQTLVNVPSSNVKGAEFQLTWLPIDGLNITAGVTYLDTVVGSFENYDSFGNPINLKGDPFPYTPKYQVMADAEYDRPLNESMTAFIGGSLHYQSDTNAAFGNNPILAIDSYTTLDLRAGVQSPDGRWRASLYGRNVTDAYYWQNAQKALDTVVRFAGMPATYGVQLSYKWR